MSLFTQPPHTHTEVITCPLLVAPNNGGLSFTPGADNSNIGLGSVAVYSCDLGYVLSGEGRRECVSDNGGSWTGISLLCQGMYTKLMHNYIVYDKTYIAV